MALTDEQRQLLREMRDLEVGDHEGSMAMIGKLKDAGLLNPETAHELSMKQLPSPGPQFQALLAAALE